MENETGRLMRIAYQAMDEKKASDIRVIDISKVSILADYFMIASGSNPNQIHAMADLIEEKFPKLAEPVQIFPIGTTIGSHTGPGTVAVFFWGDERDL